jgi:undecaprenyl-diphosphatase
MSVNITEGGIIMEFLKVLETARLPFLDSFFSAVTYLGDELMLTVVVLIMLWCFDKKAGYRLLFIGLIGDGINQLLKAIFVVPRPWVRDPSFKIVEAARAGAGGYSFPSGHVQSSSALFGSLAWFLKRRWATIVCILCVLITAFSRMYLGVHTPADVGVSLVTGAGTVILFGSLFDMADKKPKLLPYIRAAGAVFILILVCFVTFVPAPKNAVEEFTLEGIANAYKLAGSMLGLLLVWHIDDRYMKFENKAVWWAQLLKCVLGLGAVIAIKTVLKEPLLSLFGGHSVADAVRYFLLVVFGGLVWPLTFRLWSRLGQKREIKPAA